MPARPKVAALMLTAFALSGCGPRNEADQRIAAGAMVFRQCTACHTIGRNAPDTDGPNLYGVVGTGIAERRVRFGYTANLKALGGVWTPDRLDRWLTNPRAMVPGTTMTFVGLRSRQDRSNVIAYLAAQNAGHDLR